MSKQRAIRVEGDLLQTISIEGDVISGVPCADVTAIHIRRYPDESGEWTIVVERIVTPGVRAEIPI